MNVPPGLYRCPAAGKLNKIEIPKGVYCLCSLRLAFPSDFPARNLERKFLSKEIDKLISPKIVSCLKLVVVSVVAVTAWPCCGSLKRWMIMGKASRTTNQTETGRWTQSPTSRHSFALLVTFSSVKNSTRIYRLPPTKSKQKD